MIASNCIIWWETIPSDWLDFGHEITFLMWVTYFVKILLFTTKMKRFVQRKWCLFCIIQIVLSVFVTFLIWDNFFENLNSEEFNMTKKKTWQIRDWVTLIHGISEINNQKSTQNMQITFFLFSTFGGKINF